MLTVLVDGGVDPGFERVHTLIHAGIGGTCTAVSVEDDTAELVLSLARAHQRSARVRLRTAMEGTVVRLEVHQSPSVLKTLGSHTGGSAKSVCLQDTW